MDTIINLLTEYGYWIVFAGALVEGESIILPASALASQGVLNVYIVAAVAFFTTLTIDQILYFVGYYYGDTLFERFPKLKIASSKAFKLLHRFDSWFILSFRFIYGIRTLSPIVIGAAKVSPAKYIPLNFIAAILWTFVSVGGGYLLGDIMMDIMHQFQVGQKYFFGGIIGLAILITIISYARKFIGKTKDNHRQ